jgi:hypothetical protein
MKLTNLFCNPFSLIILSSFDFQLCFAQPEAKRSDVKSSTSAQDVLPEDIAAGRQFAPWLDAFTSGRLEILQQFIAANFEPPNDVLPIERMTNRQF